LSFFCKAPPYGNKRTATAGQKSESVTLNQKKQLTSRRNNYALPSDMFPAAILTLMLDKLPVIKGV
jgi:hypothetical protein